MSDLVVFVALVGVMAGAGIVLGMIVAGRLDRLLAPPAADSPMTGPDPSTSSSAPQEEQS